MHDDHVALSRDQLASVAGGGTSNSTVALGIQLARTNLGVTSFTSKTDFQSCLDYVHAHGQSEGGCESVRSLADPFPRMADSSVHGAGTPTSRKSG